MRTEHSQPVDNDNVHGLSRGVQPCIPMYSSGSSSYIDMPNMYLCRTMKHSSDSGKSPGWVCHR